MSEIELKVPSLGSRSKVIGIGVVVAAVALFFVDYLILRGEQVSYDSASLGSEEPLLLGISQVGEEHLVEIDTHRQVRGKTKGQAVKIRFEDPEGKLIYEKSEITSKKDRYFRFKPEVAGEYRLFVDGRGGVYGSSSGRVRAAVFVNDRRIVARLLAFVPI
jgi:hypothetical protein